MSPTTAPIAPTEPPALMNQYQPAPQTQTMQSPPQQQHNAFVQQPQQYQSFQPQPVQHQAYAPVAAPPPPVMDEAPLIEL